MKNLLLSMKLFSVKTVILTALITLWASPLIAGVVFQVETTYHSGSGSGKSTMSVEKPNMKIEILPGTGGSSGDSRDEVVYRGDKKKMVVIDHRNKTYMEIDSQTVQEIGGQVKQAMSAVEKQLQNLDPKQREMMEKMMKGRMPGTASSGSGAVSERLKSEFRKTSERATKNGYPCVKYEVLRGGEKVQELWVTDWSNVKGAGEVRDVFKDMADFYGELMESISQMAGSFGGSFFDGDNLIESLTRVNGFPVVTRSFEGGELESETVLESVTERDLDPDAFEPPKGYRLRTMGPQ